MSKCFQKHLKRIAEIQEQGAQQDSPKVTKHSLIVDYEDEAIDVIPEKNLKMIVSLLRITEKQIHELKKSIHQMNNFADRDIENIKLKYQKEEFNVKQKIR